MIGEAIGLIFPVGRGVERPATAELIDFEKAFCGQPRFRKIRAIHDTFGVTLTRYDGWIAQILPTTEAFDLDPVFVGSLREQKSRRRGRRSFSGAVSAPSPAPDPRQGRLA